MTDSNSEFIKTTHHVENVLGQVARQAKDLGTGLQNAAAGITTGPGISVRYLFATAELLSAAQAKVILLEQESPDTKSSA